MHEHGHGHTHGGGADARRLTVALALIVAFMVGEVVVGVLAHSLALLSDAAHMLTDAGALVMSLVVLRLAAQPASGNRTFGLRRSEILSAQANGAALLVLAGLIVYGAVRRLVSPPAANGWAILVVALVGIGVNFLATCSSRAPTGCRSTSRGASSTCSTTCSPSSPRRSRAH